ncbi:MAG: glutamate 5-kinase [bacterium]
MENWKTCVLKIGSSLIAPDGQGCSTRYLLAIAQFVLQAREQGKQLVLVSSGSVAAGRDRMKMIDPKWTDSITDKQALAAIGQSELIAFWQQLFDFPCAQILLTRDDIRQRRNNLNARSTIHRLLELGTIPIVNENDSVAVDEIKLGDNDQLAAQVAVMSQADLLIILSDVDGLYDRNPDKHADAKLLKEVSKIDEQVMSMAGDSLSAVGTGGMITKLQAARITTSRGIPCLIANGKKALNLNQLSEKQSVGTYFHALQSPLDTRQHWLLHGADCNGCIEIDQGAAQALSQQGASLLPAGITKIEGVFRRGDVVEVKYKQHIVARGISQYNSDEIKTIMGARSDQIQSKLGYRYTKVVIHRNDLVVIA